MLSGLIIALRLMLPSAATLVAITVSVLAICGAFTAWSVHERNVGWQNAVDAIAAQDKEAVDAVNKSLDTINACRAVGGVWRQASGECERW